MKNKLVSILLAGLSFTSFAQSPTPTAAPIVVPTPTTVSVTQPVEVTLSPAQVQSLLTLLGQANINLPAGVKIMQLRMILTGTNAGGAIVILRF